MATTSPGADAGGLVDVRHRHQPRRARDLRLPPPRPQDLPARHCPQPLRARRRLSDRPGPSTSAEATAVWDVLDSHGRRLDHPPLPGHLPARRHPAGCSPGWACPTSGAASARPRSTARAPTPDALEGRAACQGRLDGSGPIATRDHRPGQPQGSLRPSRPVPIAIERRPDSPGPRRSASRAQLEAGLVVAEGNWSDWLRVSFKAGDVPDGPRDRPVLPRPGSGQPSSFTPRRSISTPNRRPFRSAIRPSSPGNWPRSSACSTRPGWSRTTAPQQRADRRARLPRPVRPRLAGA